MSGFFDVANHPNLTFTTAPVSFDDGAAAQVAGGLAVHGQSRPVTIVATVAVIESTATVKGEPTIDRHDWGVSMVKMGSGVLNRVEVTATFTRKR